jgi:hypothetical protein
MGAWLTGNFTGILVGLIIGWMFLPEPAFIRDTWAKWGWARWTKPTV